MAVLSVTGFDRPQCVLVIVIGLTAAVHRQDFVDVVAVDVGGLRDAEGCFAPR